MGREIRYIVQRWLDKYNNKCNGIEPYFKNCWKWNSECYSTRNNVIKCILSYIDTLWKLITQMVGFFTAHLK